MNAARPHACFRAVSYNVENFFDAENDPLVDDDEFTPEGSRQWTHKRYLSKAARIAKTIMAAGEGEAPFLVGLCEVENDRTLQQLVCRSPLRSAGYCYTHFESRDPRGIDVALLYQDSLFHLEESEALAVKYSGQAGNGYGRDILFARGVLPNGQRLHVYVCHLPSRINGDRAETKRCQAMEVLRRHVESVLRQDPQALILIMGDFNDCPTDRALMDCLQASAPGGKASSSMLYNMAAAWRAPIRSQKHQGDWNMLDQIIVSGALLQDDSKTKVTGFKVFAEEFLLQNDAKWTGKKPYRTYSGQRYIGGFSDHLPVYVDFTVAY